MTCRFRITPVAGVLVAALFALMLPAAAIADVVSDFDSGLDGWVGNLSSEVTWASGGGNPDGYALWRDGTGTGGGLIQAPTKFLGDWSSQDGIGSISYDHKFIAVGGGARSIHPYYLWIEGPGGTAMWLGATPTAPTGWVSMTAQIKEADWTVHSGTWDAILSDVTLFAVGLELVNNGASSPLESSGLDNVRLTTAAVPLPSAAFAGLGLLGILAAYRRARRRRAV